MNARQLIEAESSTLVIHLDDRSTDFLKAIYEGKGYPVISGKISRQELLAEIKRHDRIFMLGHGGGGGLFGAGFLVDSEFGPALAEKPDGLYIWCHADTYAKSQKLSGLVSGMFISEVGEASMNGIRATQAEVDASNAAFSKAVRRYLDTGASPHTVRGDYSSATCKITQFNSDRLYVFDKGVPSHTVVSEKPRPAHGYEYGGYWGGTSSHWRDWGDHYGVEVSLGTDSVIAAKSALEGKIRQAVNDCMGGTDVLKPDAASELAHYINHYVQLNVRMTEKGFRIEPDEFVFVIVGSVETALYKLNLPMHEESVNGLSAAIYDVLLPEEAEIEGPYR